MTELLSGIYFKLNFVFSIWLCSVNVFRFRFANRISMLMFKCFKILVYLGAAPCENMSSGICGQRRPGSDCADAQSDQGFRCLETESLDTVECFN